MTDRAENEAGDGATAVRSDDEDGRRRGGIDQSRRGGQHVEAGTGSGAGEDGVVELLRQRAGEAAGEPGVPAPRRSRRKRRRRRKGPS